MTTPANTLYYGDNLNILRDYVATESVDLIYLDPPFNSNRSYNVLFKDERGKKGADKGIDGVINFIDDSSAKSKRVLVQVKSGHVSSATIRDLVGTVTRENAAMGVLVTLEPATRDMKTEAAGAGIYRSPGWGQDFPRIQILTIEELLERTNAGTNAGTPVRMPPPFGTFKQAQPTRRTADDAVQPGLGFGLDDPSNDG